MVEQLRNATIIDRIVHAEISLDLDFKLPFNDKDTSIATFKEINKRLGDHIGRSLGADMGLVQIGKQFYSHNDVPANLNAII